VMPQIAALGVPEVPSQATSDEASRF
jgi:hypothetical protein